MHRKELVHIVEKRFSSLLSNWGGMQQLNKDAIHEWRVDYKKLRALIRLGVEHKKKLEIPSSLKEVYSIAGEIRDRQMQMERMIQWFGNESLFPPGYTAMLQDEINGFADQLKPLTENDSVLQISQHNILSTLPSHISKKSIESFLQQQLLEIRNILWLTYKKDDYMHLCRKHLKDLQYLIEAIGLDHIHAEKVKGLPAFDQLHEAAHELGDFNDQCVTMQFLSSSYLNRLPGEEKIILSSYKTKMQRDKTKAKNKLILSLEILLKDLL